MFLDSTSQTSTRCILLDKYEDIHVSALDEKLKVDSLEIKTS